MPLRGLGVVGDRGDESGRRLIFDSISTAPSGLGQLRTSQSNVETWGYSHGIPPGSSQRLEAALRALLLGDDYLAGLSLGRVDEFGTAGEFIRS